jgi:hypothetical protein
MLSDEQQSDFIRWDYLSLKNEEPTWSLYRLGLGIVLNFRKFRHENHILGGSIQFEVSFLPGTTGEPLNLFLFGR